MLAFGVFDHVDDSGRPIAEQFADRLRLVEAIEAAGIYGYHVAEHHGTRLSLAASPSVYLAAVAQRTTRLRFGPMVYTAALYHPMRLAEEICMLDQISGGRLLLGLGKGAVFLEQQLYDVDPAIAAARHDEVRAIVMAALTQDEVDFEGTHFTVRGFPMVLRPFQQPHPPLWYGLGSSASARWAAANDVNCLSLLPAAPAAALLDAYRQEWARLGKADDALPFLGVNRHIVVADSEAEALRIANEAFPRWRASFAWLWDRKQVPFPFPFPETWSALQAAGLAIAGDPATVADYLTDQRARTGSTYLGAHLVFGAMRTDDALASIALYGRAVMPNVA